MSSQKQAAKPIPKRYDGLFDFYDHVGGVSLSEKWSFGQGLPALRRVRYVCSIGTLIFGWLYLIYLGLLKPALILAAAGIVCVALVLVWESWWWMLPYVLLQIWAAFRAHYSLYLKHVHGLKRWW